MNSVYDNQGRVSHETHVYIEVFLLCPHICMNLVTLVTKQYTVHSINIYLTDIVL